MRQRLYMIAAAAVTLISQPAWAARYRSRYGDFNKPTGPPELDKIDYWLALGIALLAFAGVCMAGFKNAKRTHLN